MEKVCTATASLQEHACRAKQTGNVLRHYARHGGSGGVVIIRALFLFLLRNHFITEFFFKKKSGDVNDEVNFPLFFFASQES
jgi:hypothetical protein